MAILTILFNISSSYLNKNYPDKTVNIGYAGFKDDILNPFVFEYSDKILNKISSIDKMDIYYNNKNLQIFVQNLLANAKSSTLNVEKLTKFFKYNDNLDKLRNSRLQDYIPELEAKRHLIGASNG